MASKLPDGWIFHRFGDFLTESRVTGSNGRTAKKITVKLYGRGVVARDETRIGSEASRYCVRRAGQFIYSKLDFLNGAFGIIPVELDGFESSLDLPCFDIDESTVDAHWLVEYVIRPAFYEYFRGSADGSRKAKRVYPEDFLSFRIPLPPLSEQHTIAGILGAVDENIARTRAVIEQLRVAKYWQMRELLTLGHPRYRTALQPIVEPWPVGRVAPDITMMPGHWRLVTLTDVARLESGHTPSRDHPEYWGGDISWVSLQDTDRLADLMVTETSEMVTEEGIANSSARILPKDTVLLLRTASVGLCSRMGRQMATSQHYANWLCSEKLNPGFLVQLFRHMDREWKRLSAGSVLPDVYMHTFNRFKVLLPPIDEQRAIADIGEAFDLRIKAETDYLAQLTEVKRGLAQGLLSGAIQTNCHEKVRGTT